MRYAQTSGRVQGLISKTVYSSHMMKEEKEERRGKTIVNDICRTIENDQDDIHFGSEYAAK